MSFKNLAQAAVLANLCVLVMAFSPALAGTLFNNNTSGSGGTAATPVFIPTPRAATAPVSDNLYTNSGQTGSSQTQPRTTPMTDSEYAQMAADVERQNAAISAQRTAAVNANFEQVAQQNAQLHAAAQIAGGAPAAAQPAQPANPYAGRTVVFSGAKKADSNKPNRLFNVQ